MSVYQQSLIQEREGRLIRVSYGRVLKATKVFDTYWLFALKRQDLFMRRVFGNAPPWTDDPILASYRFTNAYRASDRVSQYLIRNVLYDGSKDVEEVFFRTMLFKFFNRINTWEAFKQAGERPSWRRFNFEQYANIIDSLLEQGEGVYSAAYIMPSPSFGCKRKHRNHLLLIEYMMRDGAPRRVGRAKSLREVFEILNSYPSLGNFLAYQLSIDLNYSELIDFSEMDFVVAGPGARDGIYKCFKDTSGLKDCELIRIVTELADEEFKRIGQTFQSLWGRSLQLIDCQNLFCEVNKYARMVHPDVKCPSGRARIKQKFMANLAPIPQWYPPKWKLKIPCLGSPNK